ncbi:MAG: MFS transporter [Desulfobacteraceae bacterium]|nr:MAG: MFS transporter [Desulfobacteraceae bacterium]
MRFHPNRRGPLTAQYFLYFGVMGMQLPFFNLYCYHLGFDAWQIGALQATRSVVLILFSIFWSILADRFQTRRPIYLLCNFASAAMWALFLLTTHFFWMLIITVLYGVFYAPLIAFLEAFAMDALGLDKKRYGRMRAWGSAAFILVVLTLGRMIDAYGVKIILSFILAGSWLQALVALGFPRSDGPQIPAFNRWRDMLNVRVTLFLVCGFLMLVSHGAYYTFYSIHLAELGYGNFFIGMCWAAAVGAEIVVMLFSERIFKKFRYETVLIVSFGAAVLRWTGMWGAESAAVLLMLQVVHAFTYGTFHMTSILYIDMLAPRETKTLGQAVNNAVTYGLGLMTGSFLSGALYQQIGARGLFALSALIAMAGGALFGSHILLRKRWMKVTEKKTFF